MTEIILEHDSVVSQCLSLLPLEEVTCPLLDYRFTKLKTRDLIQIFVAAQLGKWESFNDMEEKIRAIPSIRKDFNFNSISQSQLCRRINDLPTELVQSLFYRIVNEIEKLTINHKGLPDGIGKLKVIDSTLIKLPKVLSKWARISKSLTAVKMHTRLVVASPDVVYPDKMIPSLGNVSDGEASEYLVTEDDAIYVFDRAYPSEKRLNDWIEREIKFVVRVKENYRLYDLEKFEIKDTSILLDAKVEFGASPYPVRLVEYTDENQHKYRVLTNCWDLEATQIAEIYKNRWAIELFFKWVKQHLRYVKVWSTKPQGVWNQMFLGLIAFGLAQLLRLKKEIKKKPYELLRLIRTYFEKSWVELLNEVFRKKTRTSKGRVRGRSSEDIEPPDIGDIALKRKSKKKT